MPFIRKAKPRSPAASLRWNAVELQVRGAVRAGGRGAIIFSTIPFLLCVPGYSVAIRPPVKPGVSPA